MAHAAVNGEMGATGAYAGLHLVSPQLNGATVVGAATYGRSPLVRPPEGPACRREGKEGVVLLDRLTTETFSSLIWLGGLRPSFTPASSGALDRDSGKHVIRETVSEGEVKAAFGQ